MSHPIEQLKGMKALRETVLIPSTSWHRLHELQKLKGNGHIWTPGKEEYLLCFDPGETTGCAVFYLLGGVVQQVSVQQLDTNDLEQCFPVINSTMAVPYSRLVIEDYRVYGYKADSHSWASLHTAKLIGYMIGMHHRKVFDAQFAEESRRVMAALSNGERDNRSPEDQYLVPYAATQTFQQPVLRMAQQAKKLATDDMLKQWCFYSEGIRHGLDAVRHGCFELLFGRSQKSS